MSDEKPKTRAAKKAADKKPDDNLLVTAAKAIGSAAGTVAASVGIHEAPASIVTAKPARAKLAPKNKSRMPRRQKKALHKARINGQKKSANQAR